MSEPKVEIVEKIDHSEYFYSKLPSVWSNKPLAKGFCDVLVSQIQNFSDTVYSWANGVSISNTEGKNLEEIWGELFDEKRQGRNDTQYRAAILSKILSLYDGGTNADVINFTRLLTFAPYARCYSYKDTRFCSLYVEGASVDRDTEVEINKAVTSGGRVDVVFDHRSECLMPAIKNTIVNENLLGAVNNSGTVDELNAILPDGSQSTISLEVGSAYQYYYPRGEARSKLFRTQEDSSVSGIIESPLLGLNSSGVYNLEVVLQSPSGPVRENLEIAAPSGTGSTNSIIFGRYLALKASSVRLLSA